MSDATPSDVHQPGPMSRLKERRRLRRMVVDLLLKATSAVQPRWPAGAPMSQGGQFAPKSHLSIAGFVKTAGPTGTNPGGMYEDPAGNRYYIKQYKDPSRAAGEHLSNRIYNALGVGAPNSFLVEEHQGWHASEIIDGNTIQALGGFTAANAQQFAKGFAADVLTANWDAVGTGADNVLLAFHQGKVHRIDNGGTLLMRAMEASGKKPEHLLDQITEFEGFLNPSMNPHYAKAMGAAGVTLASVKDPNSSFMQDVKGQVEKIVALRDAHNGWKGFVETVNPSWNGKDKDRVVQMLEARTKLLAEKVGLAATGKEIAAAVTNSNHVLPGGIQLPAPSAGSGYAAKGYNKGLASMGEILNNPNLTAKEKAAAIENLKGPTEAHFFGKKFSALKKEVAGQLHTVIESAKAKAVPIPTPPVVPLPANSGIHKAKWQQKAIDTLHAAAQQGDPLTAIGQVALGPSHSGTVKKYKAELLAWAANQLPGTVSASGQVHVASMPKAQPLGITPAATKLAQVAHDKMEKHKEEWETANPMPKPPPSLSQHKFDSEGKPTSQTLKRIQMERAARTDPDLVDVLLGGSASWGYGTPSDQKSWAYDMKVWAEARAKAVGGLTGKTGENFSGYEIHTPSVSGGQPTPVPKEYVERTYGSLKNWAWSTRQLINKTDNEAGQALDSYQGSGYGTMNQHLIYQGPAYKAEESQFKKVRALQRALTHPLSSLPEDTKVIRNWGDPHLAAAFLSHATKLQGATINHKTFLSSSLNGHFSDGSPIQLVIHAKKGTKALLLGSPSNKDSAYESEVLFPAQTKFHIHRIHKKKDEVVQIIMSVVD